MDPESARQVRPRVGVILPAIDWYVEMSGIAGVRSQRGAGVAKPVNAEPSQVSELTLLWVRIPPPAPSRPIDSADCTADVSHTCEV